MPDSGFLMQAYLLGWAVAAPVGPVNLEIIRRGLKFGIAAGFLTGVGATMIDAGYILLTGFGLAGLLRHRPFLLASLTIGAGFMLWLAWGALREAWLEWLRFHPGSAPVQGHAASEDLTTSSIAPSEPPRKTLLKSWLVGLGMTASNPMTIVFWATLPGLLFRGQQPAPHTVLTAAGMVWLGTISWVLLLMVVLATGRRLVGPRLFAIASAAGGVAMLYFAGRFAWLAVGIGLLGKNLPGAE